MSDWYVFGNTYNSWGWKTANAGEKGVPIKTTFYSLTSAIARSIRVEFDTDKNTTITVSCTPFYYEQLITAAKNIISDDVFENPIRCYKDGHDDECIDIMIAAGTNEKLNTLLIANKIVELFTFINGQCGYQAFSSELMLEIRQLIDFLYHYEEVKSKGVEFRHLLVDGSEVLSHTNPDRMQSTALINFIFKFAHIEISDKAINYFIHFLARGENPNQRKSNNSPVQIGNLAVLFGQRKVIEALIFYGANLFARTTVPYSDYYLKHNSPYEDALHFYNAQKNLESLDILTLIQTSLSKLQKAITKSNNIKLVSCKIIKNQNSINTSFNFSDGNTISTEFKHANNLSPVIKEYILNLREKIFDLEDINFCLNENFYIETIFHQSKLIGFNIFEIVTPKDKKDNVVIFHVVYMFLLKEFRDYHLMRLLKFRFAFALQTLLRNHDVIVFYTPISPPGFNTGKDFLYVPRHQPPRMDENLQRILTNIYQGKKPVTPKRDGLICYVLEDAPAGMPGLCATKTDVTLDYIFKYILGGVSKEPDGKIRGLPIYFYIGEENYIKESKFTESELGIHLAEHCCMLANCLRDMLNPKIGYILQGHLDLGRITKNTASLFWNKIEDPHERRINPLPSIHAKY